MRVPRFVYSGWGSNAVITLEGKTYVWGKSNFNQLGIDQIADVVKEPYFLNKSFKKIWFGTEYCFATDQNNDVYSWGWNEHGTLGHGHFLNISKPSKLELTKVKTMGCGGSHCLMYTDSAK